jgi:hypothetical protein
MGEWPHGVEDVDGVPRAMLDCRDGLIVCGIRVADADDEAVALRAVNQFDGAGKLGRHGQNPRVSSGGGEKLLEKSNGRFGESILGMDAAARVADERAFEVHTESFGP